MNPETTGDTSAPSPHSTPSAPPPTTPRQRQRRAFDLPAIDQSAYMPSASHAAIPASLTDDAPPMPRWSAPSETDEETWARFYAQMEWAHTHNVQRAGVVIERPYRNDAGKVAWATIRTVTPSWDFDLDSLRPGEYRIRFRGARNQWGVMVRYVRAHDPDTADAPDAPILAPLASSQTSQPSSRVHAGLDSFGQADLGGSGGGGGMLAILMRFLDASERRADAAAASQQAMMLKMIEIARPPQTSSLADQLTLIKTVADMKPAAPTATDILSLSREIANDLAGEPSPTTPNQPAPRRKDPWERIAVSLAPLVEKGVDAWVTADARKARIAPVLTDSLSVPALGEGQSSDAGSGGGGGGHSTAAPVAPVASSGVPGDVAGAASAGEQGGSPALPPGEPPTDEQVAQAIAGDFVLIMAKSAPWPESKDWLVASRIAAYWADAVPDDQTEQRIEQVTDYIAANVNSLGATLAENKIAPGRAMRVLEIAPQLIRGEFEEAAEGSDE